MFFSDSSKGGEISPHFTRDKHQAKQDKAKQDKGKQDRARQEKAKQGRIIHIKTKLGNA